MTSLIHISPTKASLGPCISIPHHSLELPNQWLQVTLPEYAKVHFLNHDTVLPSLLFIPQTTTRALSPSWWGCYNDLISDLPVPIFQHQLTLQAGTRIIFLLLNWLFLTSAPDISGSPCPSLTELSVISHPGAITFFTQKMILSHFSLHMLETLDCPEKLTFFTNNSHGPLIRLCSFFSLPTIFSSYLSYSLELCIPNGN